MFNLFFRSLMALALLFGLLFAVGMAVVFYFDLPLGFAILFALGAVFLQYLLGPWIIELIYKIQWKEMKAVDPSLGQFVENIFAAKGIPLPRFGVIEDGNPNAFTFGHYPSDARLVVTSGLLGKLNQGEVQAVVAHELGHIAAFNSVLPCPW
jgi:heat shock protein HtpX